jgi:hypothetical protein
MEAINEGGTSRIYLDPSIPGYVCKIPKRVSSQAASSMEKEKAIHARLYDILQDDKFAGSMIRVPELKDHGGLYCMKQVNVSRPLSDQSIWDELTPELQEKYIKDINVFLKAAAKESIFLKDVEVFVQPDSTLCFLDFGQVTSKPSTRLNSAAVVPASVVNRITIGGRRKYRTRRRKRN